MLKKYLYIAVIVIGLSAYKLSANDHMSGGSLGYTSNTIKSENPTNGGYINFDLMFPVSSSSAFYYGLGVDTNIMGTNTNGFGQGDGAYTMGATAKVGYSFSKDYNVPVQLKSGIGYGVFDIGDDDSWGMQYEASADVTLYANIGIGIKYKVVNVEARGESFDLTSAMAYISFMK
jgi:hypothetical protein